MTNDAHVDLFSPFGIHIHIDWTMHTLRSYDNRNFSVHTTGEGAPNFRVFWGVFAWIINWKVTQASSMDDNGLIATLLNGFNFLCMLPWAGGELSDSHSRFVLIGAF